MATHDAEPSHACWSLALAALAALALAACGEKEEPEIGDATTTQAGATRTIPGGADAAETKVIDAWARTLRRGDIDGAAGYFALPSVTENGPQLLRITDRAQARSSTPRCRAARS